MTIADFRSDNTHGVSPEILDAIVRANAGLMTSYGGDEITARLRERCGEIFDHDVAIFPVISGTADPIFGADAYRLVTAFDTREDDVDAFLAAVRA